MPAHLRRFAACLILFAGLPLAVAAQNGPPVGSPLGQKNDDKDRGGLGISPPHIHIPLGAHGSGGEKPPAVSPNAPVSEPKYTPPTGVYEPRFTPPPRVTTVEPPVTIPRSSLSTVEHVPVPRTGGFGWLGGIGAGVAGGLGAIFRALFGRKKE
jgi:hypothetical protein